MKNKTLSRSGRGLRTISLAAVIFFTVSGGPYGLEPLLYYGKEAALPLLVIIPVLWDIPSILMVLELNSLMPVNGGYYQWVKKALGLRWAFYEGWWTWLYTFVDLAIYPVLFVEYLGFFFPGIDAFKVPICIIIIWLGAAINILGIKSLGRTALVLSGCVIIPFIILFVAGLQQHHFTLTVPHASLKGNSFSSLGLPLYTVMWSFIGWDNATTYAGEVDRPARSYISATLCSFAGIFLMYFITVYTAQRSGMDMAVLNEQGFPALGQWLGGRWLGAVIALGGMASSFGIYLALLLSVSRVPKEMAEDKLLPAVLTRLHPKFNTPWVSICIFSLVASLLCRFTFADLLTVDVTLYGAGLLLEFASLLVMRLKLPLAKRAFKIPLNTAGLVLLCMAPLTVLVVGLGASILHAGLFDVPVLLTLGGLLSAELAWLLIMFFRRMQKKEG